VFLCDGRILPAGQHFNPFQGFPSCIKACVQTRARKAGLTIRPASRGSGSLLAGCRRCRVVRVGA
jgi:hypothetical protein